MPLLLQFTPEGCGRWKSCLIDPVGCNPSMDTNCFFLSFSTLGQKVSFELSGPAQGYVSFALSKDKWMVRILVLKLHSVHYNELTLDILYSHDSEDIIVFLGR